MKAHIDISSMKAALNSTYCMRATLAVRKKQMEASDISESRAFHYKEGQHTINGNGNGKSDHVKVVLPPQVKISPTLTGKRWSTPAMKVELRGDVLEIRDGFGNIVDSIVVSTNNQPLRSFKKLRKA